LGQQFSGKWDGHAAPPGAWFGLPRWRLNADPSVGLIEDSPLTEAGNIARIENYWPRPPKTCRSGRRMIDMAVQPHRKQFTVEEYYRVDRQPIWGNKPHHRLIHTYLVI